MFPKGQQKKKETLVVMVDGKGPQTVPTMDTPPEAKKFPKCGLVKVIVFLLLVSLVLLAGYCAWLFFAYSPTDDAHVVHDGPDSLPHEAHAADTPTTVAPTRGDVRLRTTAPPDPDSDAGSVSLETPWNADSSDDFLFVSSLESVYDSSEPYGNSVVESYSSSFSVPAEDYEYSNSDTSSSDGTTRKGDRYLSEKIKGISPFERIKQLLSRRPSGEDLEGPLENPVVEPSYEVKSSYWYKDENPSMDDDSDAGLDSSWDDVFNSIDWIKNGGGGDEVPRVWESLTFSDVMDDLIFDSSSDDEYYGESGSGSGDGDWPYVYDGVFDDSSEPYGNSAGKSYSSFELSRPDTPSDDNTWIEGQERRPDHIPPPMTSPPVIDQLPPERIEISVCNWPQKLLDRDATALEDGSMKFALKSRREYEVLGLSMNNVSITQMFSERDGSKTIKIFMRDYVNSIVAVRYFVRTPMASASNCYFSFLTPDLEQDSLTDDYGIDDEMGGSGYPPEDDLQEFTLEVRNPVQLGGNLPLFNDFISDICESSKKYWATSINVMH